MYFKISFVLRKTGLPVIEIKWLKKKKNRKTQETTVLTNESEHGVN